MRFDRDTVCACLALLWCALCLAAGAFLGAGYLAWRLGAGYSASGVIGCVVAATTLAMATSLIHENYFMEYCQEMLEDCGDLPKDLPSYIVIDWERTAENLRHDYTSIDYDGETYYVR